MLISFLAAYAGSAALSADPCTSEMLAVLEAQLPGWLEEARTPGAAVTCIRDGEIAWSVYAGERAAGEPASADTVWNVASLTKPVTAEITLALASRANLSIDTPMSRLYTDADLEGDEYLDALTARRALQHQSGFANWRGSEPLAFQFEPGTATGYSGEAYTYLGRFAETALGQDYPAIAENVLFDQLGLADMSYVMKPEFEGRLATGHDATGTPVTARSSGWSGADDLLTTSEAYAGFVTASMDAALISPELAAQRFTIVDDQIAGGCPLPEPLCPTAVGFGLGWEIFEFGETRVIQHGGADAGERALAWYQHGSNHGAVLITNGAEGGRVIAQATEVLYPVNPAYTAILRLQSGMELPE